MKLLEHKEVIDQNLLDKYINLELNEEMETALEEHLLFCSDCKVELRNLEKTVSHIRSATYHSSAVSTKPDTSKEGRQSMIYAFISRKYLVVAATLVGFIGLGAFLFILLFSDRGTETLADSSNQPKDESSIHPKSGKEATLTQEALNPSNGPIVNQKSEPNLLASIYKPNPLYESMIHNIVRAETFRISSPQDSLRIEINSSISFQWENSSSNTLTLYLISNTGITYKSFENFNPSAIKSPSEKGLYYWKLDSFDETLAAGKIYCVEAGNF